ncbi:MAG TPA: hypothetical protein VIM11_02775 [Tepidisphaeraceae bacterium]
MTLNLTEREMVALEELSASKDMTKTAVIRQAIRLYQLLDAKLSKGERLVWEDDKAKTKSELVVL